MEAPLSPAPAIYPACCPPHPTAPSVREPYPPLPPSLTPIILVSPLSPSGSRWFLHPFITRLPRLPPHSCPSHLTRRFFSSDTASPRGNSNFSDSRHRIYPIQRLRRAYKDGPESNKTDNARDFRECTQAGQPYPANNRRLIDSVGRKRNSATWIDRPIDI